MDRSIIGYSDFLDIKDSLDITTLYTAIKENWDSRRYADEFICLDKIFRQTQEPQWITTNCLKYYLKITGLIKEVNNGQG